MQPRSHGDTELNASHAAFGGSASRRTPETQALGNRVRLRFRCSSRRACRPASRPTCDALVVYSVRCLLTF